MNIVDVTILIVLLIYTLLGLKRGFTRELLSLIGIFAVIVLSFLFKNPISVILYNNLPFFNFGGIFKDITVLNILVYEVIAFIIVFIILFIILKILMKLTKVFEKFLTATVILGIPSKVLGAIVGLIEGIVYTFIVIYILSLPTFNIVEVKESSISNILLDKTPILHNICDKTLDVYNEVIELKKEYENTDNIKEFNQRTLKIMIDNNVISKENAIKLIESGKIKNVTLN